MNPDYDIVGYWSEIKVEIVRKYAEAYSTVMSKQSSIKKHIYIDGFAGPGVNLSRASGEYIPGSPLNALNVNPPFKEFHFIDADGNRAQQLRLLAGNRPNVFTYEGDCNEVLPKTVLPRALYRDYARALCVLDPYNIDLSWEVVEQAGKMKSVEIFLNFMIMDINMNVLLHDPDKVDPKQIARMNRLCGGDWWRSVAYDTTQNLFGLDLKVEGNEAIVQAYQQRLRDVAGFEYVPDPIPMRNRSRATVYYLFFASQNATGNRIVEDIFRTYREKGLN